MKFQAFGITDIGNFRHNNEDSFLIREDLGLFAVADGMGGHHAGEVASRLAVDTLALEVECANRARPKGEVLRNAATAAHDLVAEKSAATLLMGGMGTTLSALLFEQGSAHIAHVGDSRIYRLRGKEWVQLTPDHSLVAEKVRAGLLSPEEAAQSPHRNLLTRALGTQSEAEFDFIDTEALPRDLFLICSDGLWGEVEEELLVKAMSDISRSAEEIARECLRLGLDAGGHDNITAVVIEIV
jgi:protein phosphatase